MQIEVLYRYTYRSRYRYISRWISLRLYFWAYVLTCICIDQFICIITHLCVCVWYEANDATYSGQQPFSQRMHDVMCGDQSPSIWGSNYCPTWSPERNHLDPPSAFWRLLTIINHRWSINQPRINHIISYFQLRHKFSICSLAAATTHTVGGFSISG